MSAHAFNSPEHSIVRAVEDSQPGRGPEDARSSEDARPGGGKRPRKGRRRPRWFWPSIAGGGILLVLIVLVLLVPVLLSTQAGARFVADRVSQDIQGEVQIGSLSLSWLGQQRANDVTVIDERGRDTLFIESAQTNLSLLAALRGRYDLDRTELSGVRADLYVDERGQTNLGQALRGVDPPDPDQPTRVPTTLSFDILLRNAQAVVHVPGEDAVVFDEISGNARLPHITDPLHVDLAGASRYAGVAGSFAANADLVNLFAADGLMTLDRARGSGTARAERLPVPGIDELLGLNGLLTMAAGDLANVDFAFDAVDQWPHFTLAANAPRMQTRLAGVVDERGAVVQDPAEANMQLEPELAQRLFGLELVEAVPVVLELTELRTPVDGFDPARTAIQGRIRFTEPATFIDETGEPFTVTQLSAQIDSDNLAERIALQLDGDLEVDDDAGRLHVEGELASVFDAQGQVQWDRMQADLVAEVENLPTVLADRLMQQDGLLIEALGDRMSLTARTSSVGAEDIEATLAIDAPRLRMEQATLRADAEWIRLVEPARLDMVIAPRVASEIVAAVTLAEPEPVAGMLQTLVLPRPGVGGQAVADVDGDVVVEAEDEAEPAEDVDVEVAEGEAAEANGFAAMFDPQRTQVELRLVGQRAIHLLDVPQVQQAMADDFELTLGGPSLADLELTITAMLSDPAQPVAIEAAQADDAAEPERGVELVALAGSPVDAMLRVRTGMTADGLGPMRTQITFDSDRAQGELLGTIAPGWTALRVDEPSTLEVTVTRELLAALDLEEQIDPTMLDEPLLLAMTIEQMQTALPFDPQTLELDAVANVRAAAPQQRQDAYAVWLGGEQTQVRMTASPAPTDDPRTRLTLDMQAERLTGQLTADLAQREDRTLLALVDPAELDMVLTQPAMRTLRATMPNGDPLVIGDVPVSMRLTQLEAQVQPLAWETVVMEGTLEAEEIALAAAAVQAAGGGNPQGAQADDAAVGAVLRNARSQLRFEGSTGEAELTLAGQTFADGQAEPGQLRLDARAAPVLRDGEWDFANARVEANADLEQVPTRLVAGMFGWEHRLVPLLGPLANLTAVMEWDGLPPREGLIDAQMHTQHLTADLPFRIEGGILELVRPVSPRLMLTPGGFDALMMTQPTPEAEAGEAEAAGPDDEDERAGQLPVRTLAEPGEIELELQALRWPLPLGDEAEDGEAGAVDPAEMAIVARLASEGLTFVHREGAEVSATLSFEMQLDGPDLSQPLAYHAVGRIGPPAQRLAEAAPGGQQQDGQQPGQPGAREVEAIPMPEGAFDVAGSITDLVDAAGQFNVDGMTVQMQGEGRDLPVAWVDDWLEQEGLIFASLGPELDLEASAELQQMSGPISLQMTSTNGEMLIVGELDDGVFRPTQSITAALQVTEAMGSRVLVGIHPIFETATTAEQPIRLDVPADGVSVPLRPLDLTAAEVPSARLTLDRLSLRRGGALEAILFGLEQITGEEIQTGEQVEAWFTPAVFRVANGRLWYDNRLDILLDERLELATWGGVNYVDEQFDLTLALPGGMLERMFGFRAPEGAMFSMAMRGRMGEAPQMDWGRAATDIGRLAAQAELAERAPIPGAILGDVFAQVLDRDVPPASVTPLPWADMELEDVEVDPEAVPDAEEPDEPEESEEPAPEDRLRDLFDLF